MRDVSGTALRIVSFAIDVGAQQGLDWLFRRSNLGDSSPSTRAISVSHDPHENKVPNAGVLPTHMASRLGWQREGEGECITSVPPGYEADEMIYWLKKRHRDER